MGFGSQNFRRQKNDDTTQGDGAGSLRKQTVSQFSVKAGNIHRLTTVYSLSTHLHKCLILTSLCGSILPLRTFYATKNFTSRKWTHAQSDMNLQSVAAITENFDPDHCAQGHSVGASSTNGYLMVQTNLHRESTQFPQPDTSRPSITISG